MDQQFREDVICRLTELKVLAKETNGKVKDHEARVRRLEYTSWTLGGMWLVIAAWLKLHILGGK